MSVAARIERTVTTDEAVALIWERIFDGTYADVAEGARALWPSLKFAPDDYAGLAVLGLIDLAENEQRNARGSRSSRPAVGYGAPHGQKGWEKYAALTWPYRAADNKQKPLIEFTADDLAAFALYAATLKDAWVRRQGWATETGALLKKHKVSRVRDLPPEVLARVDASAREAMGRQE